VLDHEEQLIWATISSIQCGPNVTSVHPIYIVSSIDPHDISPHHLLKRALSCALNVITYCAYTVVQLSTDRSSN
jgi:hypothetical protein